MLDKPARRKSVNVSVSASLVAEAKALDINLSRTAEAAFARAVANEKSRRWKGENREAIEASNAYVEKHGLPLSKHRMF